MKYFISTFFMLPYIALSIPTKAQDISIGYVPEVAMSLKINEKTKINSKIESFHPFFSSSGNELSTLAYEGTDLQAFLSRKLNPFYSFALGYQYGVRPGEPDSHRTIQQLSFVRKPGSYFLGHRLRTDQTFYSEDPVKFRIRYRFSVEIPLKGQSIDPGEPFLIASDELIFGLQQKETELENRLVIAPGYYFRNGNKIQIGVDYRYNAGENDIWLKTSCYLNL